MIQKKGDILKILSDYGQVHKFEWKISASTKKFKGFCFIKYKTKEAYHKAKKELNGRKINGRKVTARTVPGKKALYRGTKTLYVTNIPIETDKNLIHSLFAQFGPVTEVKRILNSGKLTKTAFINFEFARAAHSAFSRSQKKKFAIKNVQLRVKLARPAQRKLTRRSRVARYLVRRPKGVVRHKANRPVIRQKFVKKIQKSKGGSKPTEAKKSTEAAKKPTEGAKKPAEGAKKPTEAKKPAEKASKPVAKKA